LPNTKHNYPSHEPPLKRRGLAVTATRDSKPFDSTLKTIFGELVGEIIPCLLSDARLQEGIPYNEYLSMHYQLHPLLAANPTIQNVIAEETAKGVAKGLAEAEAIVEARGEARGIIKGLQEGILDLINDHFSTRVVTRVQQTIASSQDIDQLKKLHRQIARASDEEEVYALLTQCFPVQDEKTKGEIEGIQVSIVDITHARFSPQVQAQIQQAIAPVEDMALLRKFHLQLACLADEQGVAALLDRCFPMR
jgi:hypothetical protein